MQAAGRNDGAGIYLSAVILSFNSARFLESSVRALAAALDDDAASSEIWVVENGSTDGSREILRRLETEMPGLVRGIYNDENTGTTVSRNMALRRARGRYILILDSDVTVLPRATLKGLIARLDADASIGIVVPELRYPDGRHQLSTDGFPTIGRKLHRFLGLRRIEETAETRTRPVPVDYAISALWLMRRETLERVGLLDERIFYSPEDVDYCIRVWEAGLSVIYDPTVSAVHDAREISRGFRMPRFTLSHARGLAYLFAKHRYGLGRRRLYRRLGLARTQG